MTACVSMESDYPIKSDARTKRTNRQHQNVNAPQVCRVSCTNRYRWCQIGQTKDNIRTIEIRMFAFVRVGCQLPACVHYDVKHHVIWQLMKWLHTINTTKCQDISYECSRLCASYIIDQQTHWVLCRANDKCLCLIRHLNGVKNLFVALSTPRKKQPKKCYLKMKRPQIACIFVCIFFDGSLESLKS